MPAFSPELAPVIEDMLPLCRALGEGRYAVSIGGSYGKRTFDASSDLDFRLFCERTPSEPEVWKDGLAAVSEGVRRWASRGVTIDGCWVRTIGEIEAQLDAWTAGEGAPADIVWTIWGYHVLTDVYNQLVIEDPYGVIAGWHARLSVYPPKLKQALLRKHLESMRYWRHDYHYRHKVERGDIVFLAGLTSRLLHDCIQVLFALNETYYPGDGNNLRFIARFERVPAGFLESVEGLLYPGRGAEALSAQYGQVLALIDAVEAMAGPELNPTQPDSAAVPSGSLIGAPSPEELGSGGG